MIPTSQNARERAFQARLARRAAENSVALLASALKRYADAEEMTWETLAASLHCTPEALDWISLCYPPRSERFVEDVVAIAGDLVPADRLLPLLRRLQVLGIFSEVRSEQFAPEKSPGILLAARDREEEIPETRETADE